MRRLRNMSALAPLTPTITGHLTYDELVKLCGELRARNKNLLSQLATLRRRHDAIESALARYHQLLEAEITEQTERVHNLSLALLPKLTVTGKDAE